MTLPQTGTMRPVILFSVLLLRMPAAVLGEDAHTQTCTALTEAAQSNDLSPAFLARVVFGAGTMHAIPDTAQRLADLQTRHGNPGLAALAFAGGEDQAKVFKRGDGVPPATVDFVILTTGQTPDTWRDAPPARPEFRLAPDSSFADACAELLLGRWGDPLPELAPLPEPQEVDLAQFDPSLRSLRPKIRARVKLAKWGAQLAFGKSRESALANYARVTRRCREIEGQTPDVIFVENRVRGRPGYWMARVSREERKAALNICLKAKQAGCPCVVYRNY